MSNREFIFPFQAVCTEFLIRYPDLIFASTFPTFSNHTFEMGIMEATSHEHEIDIDKEIAKRAGNDDLAKCISVGNDEDLTVQKVSTIFGFTDFTNS